MAPPLRNPCKSSAYTVSDPTDCDGEILPAAWQDYAEAKGISEPDIWPLWRRFKQVTRYPFQRTRWHAYIDKVMANRQARKDRKEEASQ